MHRFSSFVVLYRSTCFTRQQAEQLERDSGLKNNTERLCNGYSKLKNIATAEVVQTDSIHLAVEIGRHPVIQDSSREAFMKMDAA